MSVYVVSVDGRAEAYQRLLSGSEGRRATSEAASAASATHLVLHVLWPRDGALHLIVEGDEDPVDFGDLLAERLHGFESEGSEWVADWEYAADAEHSPVDLVAGRRGDWVIQMAVEPDLRRCESCQRVGVPPHRGGCDFELRDDNIESRTDLDADQRGPTLYLDDEDDEHAETEEEAMRPLTGV